VAAMSEHFRMRLARMQFKHSSRFQTQCRRNGMLATTEETTLLLLPALNIDRKTAQRGLDILERSA